MKVFLNTFALSAFLATATLAGSAEFHPSTYTTYKKHSAYDGSVRVLDALPRDERSYTEIGMVRIPTSSVSSYYEALDKMKEITAQHGGTAIALEDDAKIYSAGGLTSRGTAPQNITATALILH